jgi:serine acetyltransferase
MVPRLAFREVSQWLRHLALTRRGVNVAPSALILGRCEIIGRVSIGARTVVNQSKLDGRGGLDIGHDVIILGATIVSAMHDLDDPRYPTLYRPVVIEPFAIIYQHATILPGRTIGRGAIVAAGAVVSKDVAPMTIVAGNPARSIRERKAVHELADIRRGTGYAAHNWRELGALVSSINPWARQS